MSKNINNNNKRKLRHNKGQSNYDVKTSAFVGGAAKSQQEPRTDSYRDPRSASLSDLKNSSFLIVKKCCLVCESDNYDRRSSW